MFLHKNNMDQILIHVNRKFILFQKHFSFKNTLIFPPFNITLTFPQHHPRMAEPSDSDDETSGDEASGETGEDHVWMKEFIQKFQPHNVEKFGEDFKMGLDCPYEDSRKLEQEMRDKYSDFDVILGRMCDACGRNGIQNETVYCCVKCDRQYDECGECHKNSKHHHTDSFEKQEPTTNNVNDSVAADATKSAAADAGDSASSDIDDRKFKSYPLIIYGEGADIRMRSNISPEDLDIDPDLAPYKDRYIGSIDLTEDKYPPSVVPYEWRDWVRRTGGEAELYSSIGGSTLIKLPDYYLELDK